jgi:hypothetical protein
MMAIVADFLVKRLYNRVPLAVRDKIEFYAAPTTRRRSTMASTNGKCRNDDLGEHLAFVAAR